MHCDETIKLVLLQLVRLFQALNLVLGSAGLLLKVLSVLLYLVRCLLLLFHVGVQL